jgi:hypothetical protein
VYQEHVKKITALGQVKGNEYYFGDETGLLSHFTFTAEGVFTLGLQMPSVMAGPISTVKYFHESKAGTIKMVVFGDSGPGGVQANAMRMSGIKVGDIIGSSRGIICAATTKAEE